MVGAQEYHNFIVQILRLVRKDLAELDSRLLGVVTSLTSNSVLRTPRPMQRRRRTRRRRPWTGAVAATPRRRTPRRRLVSIDEMMHLSVHRSKQLNILNEET
jgi:hypothetical protein